MKAHTRKILTNPLFIVLMITSVTTVLFLYTSGYRLNKKANTNTIDLQKTGMISAKSLPEGASVYLNGKILTATNDTISGINPGKYTIEIMKKGLIPWKKDIEVFPELVTDITAVLVSQSPRLEPLTNTGANFPSVSPSLSNLAYFSKDAEVPGVWIIPLSQGALSLFRTSPSVVVKDTASLKFSNGLSIEWSPDEKSLLIQMQNNKYYLANLETNNIVTASDPEIVRKEWTDLLTLKRTDFTEKLELPEDKRLLAVSNEVMWSPDDKKFLYTVENTGMTEYWVYNLEKPIPVGEKVETLVFSTPTTDPQPKITWYYDSFHLILTEGSIETEKRGKISLVRIDGSNKTEIYNNSLYSSNVFSAPGGDKIIILTSFKSGDQSDLYTIGIR